MKIVRLTASNVKRLKAVEITPDGTLQVITGRNAQGKTSVLDAIWLALGGGAASREISRPIRAGEDEASVTLDLGDLIVSRTWDENGKTALTVTAADGARYRSPQTLLDQLVGKLSFDPLAFTRLKPAEQREALLDLLGLDFTDADRERARLYDQRLDTGRKAHAYGDLPKLPKDAPVREVSAATVLDRIGTAQRQRRAIDDLLSYATTRRNRAVDLARQIEQLTKDLEAIERQIAATETQIDAAPVPEDMDALRAELEGIESRNTEARENARILAAREAQKALEGEYTDLSHAIDGIDARKADALAAAEMPVEGLGFDDQGVTFRGVPFSQASSAEQIRVSLAMAMALNPTLRVIRILDGSLLDADSMAAITAMASDADYQVWVERVDDATGSAVVIEDGAVKARS